MSMTSRRYIIICPVRNEEKHLRGTIESIAKQTVPAARLVLVNDGSTDRTGEIAQEAARTYNWITVIQRADRGFRRNGGGVIDTFYDGFKVIEGESWDYLIKLDGDLSFAPDYFEKCFLKFEKDEKLGIGGGTIYINTPQGPQVEAREDPAFHVRGATKIYRRACWDGIGGLLREAGWDTLDEVKANMLGWRTFTFPDLQLMHHRETGGADGSWKNWVKNGRANYIVGYHPLFMVAKCVKRLTVRPYVLGSAGLLAGFFGGYLKRVPQIKDRELIRYLRREQIRKLLNQESLWERKAG